jgi:hypothetical protein
LVLDVDATMQSSTKYPRRPVQSRAHVVLRVSHSVGCLLGEAAQAVVDGWLLGKRRIGGSGMSTSRSGIELAPGQSIATKGYGKAILVLRGVDIKYGV